jgi:hypothetical protein
MDKMIKNEYFGLIEYKIKRPLLVNECNKYMKNKCYSSFSGLKYERMNGCYTQK